MEFRKYKRKIAAMIIGCLLLTNQTNAYGNFIFIDEDIGCERSVASASEATGSEATESEADEKFEQATSSEAESSFVVTVPAQEDIPDYYTELSGENVYWCFLDREGEFQYRIYGMQKNEQKEGFIICSKTGEIKYPITFVSTDKEDLTLAAYRYKSVEPGMDAWNGLSFHLFEDIETIQQMDKEFDESMGMNGDGTNYGVWMLSKDLNNWNEPVQYYMYGHVINSNEPDLLEDKWYQCNEQGDVYDSLYINPNVKYDSSNTVTGYWSGNNFIIEGHKYIELGNSSDPYMDGFAISANGARTRRVDAYLCSFTTDHDGYDGEYMSGDSGGTLYITPGIKKSNGMWEAAGPREPIADSYSWTVNEEYSSSKRWAGTVKLVLYNLRSTENVAVEKVCLTYGYTTKRAEGSGSTSDEYDVSSQAETNGKATVSFNGNGAANPSSRTVYKNSAIGTLPILSRTGYTFKGWYTAASGGSQVSESTIVTGNVTYYAQWTPINYTVTFSGNGGSTSQSSRTVGYGSGVGTLPSATRTGYNLVGWYTASSGGSQISANTTITGNVTYYAQWSPITYTIRFNANGGSGTMKDLAVSYDSSKNLTANSFTRPAYLFQGWSTNADGTGITYTDQQTIKNLTTTHNQVINLYAKWKLNECTITYDTQGGSCATSTKKVICKTDIGSDALPIAERYGYTFKGWSLKQDGPHELLTPNSQMESVAVTVYAQWQANSYPITFDPAGGTLNESLKMAYYDSPLGELPEPTKTGQIFTGWKTSSRTRAVPEIVTPTTVLTEPGLELVASYSLTAYTIHFDPNGGETDAVDIQRDYGQTYGTLPAASRTGYTFKGWFTEREGGIMISASSTTPAYDQTLYAHWMPVTYQVQYNANGGSGTMLTQLILYGSTVELLPNKFSRAYHRFDRWATSEGGGGDTYADGAPVTNLTDRDDIPVILYAQWVRTAALCTFYDWDDTVLGTESYDVGGSVNFPAPSRTGYTFAGWEGIDGAPITGITEPGSYRATYNVNQYSAIFINDDQKNEIKKNYGEPLGTLPVAEKEGHTFIGWNAAEDGTGGVVTEEMVMPAGGMTCYAQFVPNDYTITFNYMGGIGNEDERNVVYNEPLGKLPEPTKTGAVFKGWNTSEDATGSMVTELTVMSAGNLQLFAVWEIQYLTCRFLDDEGQEIERLSVPYGQAVAPQIPIKKGYVFKTWDKELDNIIENTTFVATFRPAEYTISFSVNQDLYPDAVGSMESVPAVYDQIRKLPANEITYNHFTFTGWTTSLDGSGKLITDAANVINLTAIDEANVILYAQFERVESPCQYVDWDNNVLGEEVIPYGQDGQLQLEPTRIGYQFTGWSPETTGITSPTVFTAQYSPHHYTVRFVSNGGNGEMENQSFCYDEAVNLHHNEYQKDYYEFIGWNTAEDGTGIAYEDKQSVKNLTTLQNGEVVLFAQWKLIFIEDTNTGTNTRPGPDKVLGTEDDEEYWNGPDGKPGTADDVPVEKGESGEDYINNGNGTNTRPGPDGIFGTADDQNYTNGADGLPGTADDELIEKGESGEDYIDNGNGTNTRPGSDGIFGTADDQNYTNGADGLPGTADDKLIEEGESGEDYIDNGDGTNTRPGPDGIFGTADDQNYTNGADGLPGTADDTLIRHSGGHSSGGGNGSSGSGSNNTIANGPGITPVSGVWIQSASGWQFQDTSGKQYLNEWAYIYNPYANNNQGKADWFRFDEKGEMKTGWYIDADGHIYYLWPVSDGTRGTMVTGWRWIIGPDDLKRCYYFNEKSDGTKGALLRRGKTPDGHIVNEKGEWVVNGVVQTK